jgi:GntR family transcriptional regulator, transcriptional repressor for pyruvate dehydrogenase complex
MTRYPTGNKAMLEPLARDTLTKQATETLRRFILSEDLKSGDQLPSERELSESLSVSRNIVREALSVLVAEELIVKQPGRGIFVTDFDRDRIAPQIAVSFDYNGRSPAALSEARAAIELGAITLSVRRITDEELERLAAINRSLKENLRLHRSTIKDDIEFHKLLLRSANNPVLIELMPLLVEHFRLAVFYRPSAIFHNPERVIAEHDTIIAALQARNVVAARQALIDHLHLQDFED